MSEQEQRARVGNGERPDAGDLMIRLSAISFTDDRQDALVYRMFYCGGLCGEGHILRLQRTPAGWRVVRSVMLWIS